MSAQVNFLTSLSSSSKVVSAPPKQREVKEAPKPRVQPVLCPNDFLADPLLVGKEVIVFLKHSELELEGSIVEVRNDRADRFFSYLKLSHVVVFKSAAREEGSRRQRIDQAALVVVNGKFISMISVKARGKAGDMS